LNQNVFIRVLGRARMMVAKEIQPC